MEILRKWNGFRMAAAALLLIIATSASATQQFATSIPIGRIFMSPNGTAVVYFGVPSTYTPPSSTCSYAAIQFQFDTSTAQGKSMYAILLAAKTAGKTIDVWYEPSTDTQQNACGLSTVSVVDAIGYPN